MSFFHADRQSEPMETPSTSITGQPTLALPSLQVAYVPFLTGSKPIRVLEMESRVEVCHRVTGRKFRMNVATMTWPDWLPRILWSRRACPCCNSVQFKPSALRRFEGLIAVFGLRPIRCMFCWRRYYWFSLRGAE